LSRACTADSLRFALDHVRFTTTSAGYRVEATNGRILVRVDGEPAHEPDDHPGPLGVLAHAEPRTCALVAARDWQRALRLAPRRPLLGANKKACNQVACALGPALAADDPAGFARTDFGASDGATVRSLSAPETPGKFPAIDQVLPKGPPAGSLKVNGRMLLDLLRIVVPFADDDTASLTVEIHTSPSPLVVLRCQGTRDGFQDVTALLMPLAP